MVKVLLAAVFGICLAVLAYVSLQKASSQYNFEIVVKRQAEDVYLFMKDPNNLPEINSLMSDVVSLHSDIDKDGTEHHTVLIKMAVPHFKEEVIECQLIAFPTELKIYLHVNVLFNLINSMSTFEVIGFDNASSRVVERADYSAPYALQGYVNRTYVPRHKQVLDILKFALEFEQQKESDSMNKWS